MTGKRFVVFDDNFSKHIEDTKYTEDKHEHNLYDAYEMCSKLNQQYEEITQLKEENQQYKILTDELKRQNKKLKGRLNDLGVEYYD